MCTVINMYDVFCMTTDWQKIKKLWKLLFDNNYREFVRIQKKMFENYKL